MNQRRDRAIVLGASVAGLAVARVLARRFRQVTLVGVSRVRALPAQPRGVRADCRSAAPHTILPVSVPRQPALVLRALAQVPWWFCCLAMHCAASIPCTARASPWRW